MLVQVRLLSELLITTLVWAFEGSLLGMHSQVVEKIMPFSEEHIALREVALEYLHLTLSSWIFVLEHSESSCIRNLLFNLYLAEVEVVSRLHMNH